ncbi:MAG TPA: hypothetical protein VMW93_10820 [bacterium]|nr:hypothetical protein [bacterium]
MRKTGTRAKAALALLVGACLALAAYVGVTGVLSSRPGAAAGADEGARKKAFEEAMAEGNLSFREAEYWRRLDEAAAPEAP